MTATEDRRPCPRPHRWDLGRAALNGVLGDHLARVANPLAIEMGFVPGPGAPAPPTGKLVVLLHGLTNLESIWDFPDIGEDGAVDNYGLRLQRHHGYTPLFLRYNTGLSLEANGRRFAALLEQRVADHPCPVESLVLLGFSMGGLVMRRAQEVAAEAGSAWLGPLTHCVYLGSPHRGARLERLGAWASALVRGLPGGHGRPWAGWIDVRSRGIQDLGHGLEDPEAPGRGYHPGARHCFVSGSLSPHPGSLANRILGDGLVMPPSACPDDAPTGSSQAHFEGIAHFPLAYSEAVYRQLEAWLEPEAAPRQGPPARALGAPGVPPPGPSGRLLVAGGLALAASAYRKTVETVEQVHRTIARQPHRVLQRTPATRDLSRAVETVHDGVSTVVYGAVGLGASLLDVAAALVGSGPGAGALRPCPAARPRSRRRRAGARRVRRSPPRHHRRAPGVPRLRGRRG